MKTKTTLAVQCGDTVELRNGAQGIVEWDGKSNKYIHLWLDNKDIDTTRWPDGRLLKHRESDQDIIGIVKKAPSSKIDLLLGDMVTFNNGLTGTVVRVDDEDDEIPWRIEYIDEDDPNGDEYGWYCVNGEHEDTDFQPEWTIFSVTREEKKEKMAKILPGEEPEDYDRTEIDTGIKLKVGGTYINVAGNYVKICEKQGSHFRTSDHFWFTKNGTYCGKESDPCFKEHLVREIKPENSSWKKGDRVILRNGTQAIIDEVDVANEDHMYLVQINDDLFYWLNKNGRGSSTMDGQWDIMEAMAPDEEEDEDPRARDRGIKLEVGLSFVAGDGLTVSIQVEVGERDGFKRFMTTRGWYWENGLYVTNEHKESKFHLVELILPEIEINRAISASTSEKVNKLFEEI